MKNKVNNYFFCYNKRLFKFLHDVKGIGYITVAINPTTQKTFALFEKNDKEFQKALDEYKALEK